MEHVAALGKRLTNAKEKEMELLASQTPAFNRAEYVAAKLRTEYAAAVIREMFGVRFNRYSTAWTDTKNPAAKNIEPKEVIFRVLYGGQVAQDVIAQLRKRDSADEPDNTEEIREADPDESLQGEVIQPSPFNQAMVIARPITASPLYIEA